MVLRKVDKYSVSAIVYHGDNLMCWQWFYLYAKETVSDLWCWDVNQMT